ncbi:helix-turn-helix domain-containing protein [Stomatohabitans albus]|uniref:helix-turn-helix domain-containing protein n=1 Tax=Stomatohabitans albus TaxID=3110766 RepID=UPI00300CDA5D
MQVSDTITDSPTRTQILDILRGSQEGQTVKDVAAMVGIHPNVARTHLTKLTQAKLVSYTEQRREQGGRPARIYRAVLFTPSEQETATSTTQSTPLVIAFLVALVERTSSHHGEPPDRLSLGWALAKTLGNAHLAGYQSHRNQPIGQIATTIANALSAYEPTIAVRAKTADWAEVVGFDHLAAPLANHDEELAKVFINGLIVGAGDALGTRLDIDNNTIPDSTIRIRKAASRGQYVTAHVHATLDTRGMDRDDAVVEAMRTMTTLNSGELLEVLCEGPGSPAAFARWADRANHDLLSVDRSQDHLGQPAIRLLFRKADS